MSSVIHNAGSSATPLSAGFQSPALDAQLVFRTLLEAWGRPGRVLNIGDRLEAPEGLDAASAAIALALVDNETPIWLSATCLSAAQWLRFHCNCPIVTDPAQARFGFAMSTDAFSLTEFDPGTALSPEQGATLFVMTESLDAGPSLSLTGPGIETNKKINPFGLPESLLADRDAMRPIYPAGIDLVLTHGERVVCLPRTTQISKEA